MISLDDLLPSRRVACNAATDQQSDDLSLIQPVLSGTPGSSCKPCVCAERDCLAQQHTTDTSVWGRKFP
jgi:hypothetical protein